MAEFAGYRLRLLAPFHSSSRGIGIESSEQTVRSDTLFSALACAVRAIGGLGSLRRLLEAGAAGSPPFVVSSTFPWAGETLFFPKPRRLPLATATPSDVPAGGRETGDLSPSHADWVSLGVLQRLLTGQPVPPGQAVVDAVNRVWYLREEASAVPVRNARWWATGTVPRVTVDRSTNRSAFFRCGRVWYGGWAGLWFLAEWRDRSWEPLFDAALAFLGEAGLGGERSAGHGQFALGERFVLRVPDVPDSAAMITLSLYHPTAEEAAAGVLDRPAAYDLELRQGWATAAEAAGTWRKGVRMLTEGSLVRRVAPRLGDLVDVTPDGPGPHRLYRAGFAVGFGTVLADVRQPTAGEVG